jgi:hypothetical protein
VDGVTPFVLTTTKTHTTGNILEVGDNGTNRFAVAFDGQASISSPTTSPRYTATDVNGISASVGLDASGNAVLEAADGFTSYLRSGLKSVGLLNTTPNPLFSPGSDNEVDVAGPNSSSWFKDYGFKGTGYMSGFESGTNYSRLAFSHGGTNLTARIDSRSLGTAGIPRPIDVQVGSTNMMSFDGLSGASTTGLLIYENGSSKRVTVGAADSGGAGFRVLRIPN